MKKMTVLLSLFFLVSCVDIIHYLGKDDRKAYTYVKVSLSKTLLEMAATLNGQNSNSINQYFLNSGKDIVEALEGDIEFHFGGLDNSSDIGFELKITQDKLGDENDKKLPFTPYKQGKKLIIPLPVDVQSKAADPQTLTSFLSSARYRLLLSRSLVEDLRGAELITDGEKETIEITPLNEIYMLTIPILSWLSAEDSCEIHLLQ
jgi:hypothetical protein